MSLEAGTQFVYNAPRILKKHLKAARGIMNPLDDEGDDEWQFRWAPTIVQSVRDRALCFIEVIRGGNHKEFGKA